MSATRNAMDGDAGLAELAVRVHVSATPNRSPQRQAQRGAALLTAMIIVTLVATLAGSMVWQQWRAVQVESAERARAQSAWILAGALDWARLILREDARNTRNGGAIDHLLEPWAVPFAEARLSTFLAADKDNTDDAPDVFLSGAITDAQARYNVSNLVVAGKVDAEAFLAFKSLCEMAGVANDVAGRIAVGLLSAQAAAGMVVMAPGAAASGPASAASAPAPNPVLATLPPAPKVPPLLPRSVAQLTWLGIEPDAVRLLSPYVVLLPRPTQVNANTASREVLAAAIKGIDLATAERLIEIRQRTPFKDVADIQKVLPPNTPPIDSAKVFVASSFFQVRGRLRMGDRVLEQSSLLERRALDVIVLQRERVSSRDQPS